VVTVTGDAFETQIVSVSLTQQEDILKEALKNKRRVSVIHKPFCFLK
jgi:hypothetical protein